MIDFVKVFPEADRVVAGISTRRGGVSRPPYYSANMALHVGDEPAAVLENRARVCGKLGINARDLVCAQQVHGNRVVRVTERDSGRGVTTADGALPGADGMITDVRALALAIFTADCVPVFLHEPTKNIVGIAHSGWRGTLSRIAEALIETMEREFGANPQSCRVALGSAAGPCCYEVGNEVISAFSESGHPLDKILARADRGKPHLDLWEANALQLEKRGVPRDNIVGSRQCTVCSSEYFSCRRDGPVTGRNMSVIMLK